LATFPLGCLTVLALHKSQVVSASSDSDLVVVLYVFTCPFHGYRTFAS